MSESDNSSLQTPDSLFRLANKVLKQLFWALAIGTRHRFCRLIRRHSRNSFALPVPAYYWAGQKQNGNGESEGGGEGESESEKERKRHVMLVGPLLIPRTLLFSFCSCLTFRTNHLRELGEQSDVKMHFCGHSHILCSLFFLFYFFKQTNARMQIRFLPSFVSLKGHHHEPETKQKLFGPDVLKTKTHTDQTLSKTFLNLN